MSYAEVETYLAKISGLDAASIGERAFARAVSERMTACGKAQACDYLALLQSSPFECQTLIEAIVIGETWFFRDHNAFLGLVTHVQGVQNTDGKSARAVRLLSLPCASGEEPYSMAMALLDVGVAADTFTIDAIDISQTALARGGLGIYGRNAFRGNALRICGHHFRRFGPDYQLSLDVRRTVQFRHGNLLDSRLFHEDDRYDVIFCRNLLIYFDPGTQARVVSILAKHVTAGGVVFVAPSEAGVMMGHGFVRTLIGSAQAFQKAEPNGPVKHDQASARSDLPKHPSPKTDRTYPHSSQPRPAQTAQPGPIAEGTSNAPPDARLDKVRRLADSGRLLEAAQCCEALLDQFGPSADALLLLGLIREATGQLSAADNNYRKALYLDPQHQGALTHLALLLERQGEMAAAKIVQARADRLGLPARP